MLAFSFMFPAIFRFLFMPNIPRFFILSLFNELIFSCEPVIMKKIFEISFDKLLLARLPAFRLWITPGF